MPQFNKNSVFTLWVKNHPTILQTNCWKSWLDLGYQVTVYCDNIELIPLELRQKISVISPFVSAPSFIFNQENLLQSTDLWRFIHLLKNGGTWLDSDLFLFKRLPDEKIIISSEHTLQAGGRKSKTTFRPNIGVLRFPPNNEFIAEVVKTLTPTTDADLSDSKNQTSKMMKFIKLLGKKKWSNYFSLVSAPEIYCPVPYPFAKEIYESDYMDFFKPKYGLELNNITDATIGVHLWANMVRTKKINYNNQIDSHFNRWCERLT